MTFALILALLIGAPLTLAVFGPSARRPVQSTRIETPVAPPAVSAEALARIEPALVRAVGNDPQGLQLLKLYRQQAATGFLLGRDLGLGMQKSRDGKNAFMVIPSSLEERRAKGVSIGGALNNQWVFNQPSRVLFVPDPTTYTEIVYGVTLAHELQHVYDLLSGVEQADSNGQAWLDGETRAYVFEIRLVDAATNGAYLKMVAQIVDERPELLGAFRTGRGTFFPDMDVRRLDAVLPPAVSEDERATRNALASIALMFEALKRVGATPDRYGQALTLFMQAR